MGARAGDREVEPAPVAGAARHAGDRPGPAAVGARQPLDGAEQPGRADRGGERQPGHPGIPRRGHRGEAGAQAVLGGRDRGVPGPLDGVAGQREPGGRAVVLPARLADHRVVDAEDRVHEGRSPGDPVPERPAERQVARPGGPGAGELGRARRQAGLAQQPGPVAEPKRAGLRADRVGLAGPVGRLPQPRQPLLLERVDAAGRPAERRQRHQAARVPGQHAAHLRHRDRDQVSQPAAGGQVPLHGLPVARLRAGAVFDDVDARMQPLVGGEQAGLAVTGRAVHRDVQGHRGPARGRRRPGRSLAGCQRGTAGHAEGGQRGQRGGPL